MSNEPSGSDLIDGKLAALGDWRGAALARLRALIHEADPEVVETVKWRKPANPAGVPVWEHAGILCTGETYKDKVKLTFANGAGLVDPKRLFNSSLDGNTRRAIYVKEREEIDGQAASHHNALQNEYATSSVTPASEPYYCLRRIIYLLAGD